MRFIATNVKQVKATPFVLLKQIINPKK